MPDISNPWSLPCGDSQSYLVPITGGNNLPLVDVYDGSETLTAEVSEGLTQTPIADVLTVAWVSGPLATTTATVNATTTADVSPGVYAVRLHVTKDGSRQLYFRGLLELLAAPAAATPPTVYGSLQDMTNIAGWFASLSTRGKLTNFLSERHRARQWLDDIIVSKSRPYSSQFELASATGYGLVEDEDEYIRGLLDANKLIVDQSILEIVAYKALAFACEGKVSLGDDQGEAWAKRARMCHARAQNRLLCSRARIDTNADGSPDVAFNLGVHSFR